MMETGSAVLFCFTLFYFACYAMYVSCLSVCVAFFLV